MLGTGDEGVRGALKEFMTKSGSLGYRGTTGNDACVNREMEWRCWNILIKAFYG